MEMLFIFIMVADTWVCKTAKHCEFSCGWWSPFPSEPPRGRRRLPGVAEQQEAFSDPGKRGRPVGGAEAQFPTHPDPNPPRCCFKRARFQIALHPGLGIPVPRVCIFTAADQGGVTGDPSPRGELRADLKTRAGAQCSPLLSYTSNKRPLWAVSLSFPDPAVAPKVCEGKIACVLPRGQHTSPRPPGAGQGRDARRRCHGILRRSPFPSERPRGGRCFPGVTEQLEAFSDPGIRGRPVGEAEAHFPTHLALNPPLCCFKRVRFQIALQPGLGIPAPRVCIFTAASVSAPQLETGSLKAAPPSPAHSAVIPFLYQ
ncbi:uncharacterized protein [Gorilla gorilla gorilla]|uniref:uncharacterized protein n=1 Tax=Gorilla gorilla gorilla TaxID=9595 RepID=UPI00300BAB80